MLEVRKIRTWVTQSTDFIIYKRFPLQFAAIQANDSKTAAPATGKKLQTFQSYVAMKRVD